jgi:hypothetical protein
VVAYSATKVAANLNEHCPCTVFGTSKDDGKTFEYRVVPPLPPMSPAPEAAGTGRGGRGGGVGGGVMLAADPTKDGRYAISRSIGRTMMVSLTEDHGKTWAPPVMAAEVPEGANFGHRAMKYSAQGVLALIWKAQYQDRSFDVWSSASRDGGRTFKTVRVSHAISPPYIPARGNFLFGDDLSSVDVDGEYVHVVWGDNRAGFEATWYGRIPLSAY